MSEALAFRAIDANCAGAIYLHSMPGRFESMASFDAACQTSGIVRLLCLTSREEIATKSASYAAALAGAESDYKVTEYAIADFSIAEDVSAYAAVIQQLRECVLAGESILIHCAAGIGRTGTAAICLLLALGESLERASALVKAAGSGPETPEQEAFVERFASASQRFEVRAFASADFERVQDIYEQGIASGNATFQMQRKSWEAWQSSMTQDCRLVACNGFGEVVGWAGLSAISSREVYRGVAEVSVYIASTARGLGLGKTLLRALVDASEEAGYWTLQAAIFPENEASLALHRHCGFSVLGRRQKLGKMHGLWRDVMLLERRSERVGVE